MNTQDISPDVSIVIPTKNGGQLFHDVLKKLREQDYAGSIEIVVIDSGSTDKTLEYAHEFGAKIKVIPPKSFNHGLTRNEGIKLSSGQIIVLITQDAVPANNKLIDRLVSTFNCHKIGGVYAQQLARSEADVLTKRHLKNWLTGRTEVEVRQMEDKITYEQLSPFDKYKFCNFDNVCSAIRRSTWEEVPFIQNEFGEDIEWCLRALEAGWKIAYQPQAIVIHSHNRSVVYEYKRTYICHRKLYELFKLQCVPSLKFVMRSVVYATITDWRYVLLHEPRLLEKLKLMIRVPALSIGSVWGQYRGAKDEKLQRGKTVSGV